METSQLPSLGCVVSQSHPEHGGVVPYDSGTTTASGFKRKGFLNAPPAIFSLPLTNSAQTTIDTAAKLRNTSPRLTNYHNSSGPILDLICSLSQSMLI
ncbi:hypothetical protein EYZ11_010605 [Aspergillus tanneri]|uniref:Uncharacterized protein n=1 Tax=Aspergillus tanneri TaxID=1220188 RepID=A0A4S3J4Y3_9EURO|nr:hypothetical protein EYZ11_010605 [Aspergillus tanneri]